MPDRRARRFSRWALAALLTLTSWLGMAPEAWATHGLAGEITYTYLGPNRYRVRLTTYTNPCAAGVDDCAATIEVWAQTGSGPIKQTYPSLENIPRQNGTFETPCECTNCGVRVRPTLAGGAGCVRYNVYEAEVTLAGAGVFELRYFRGTRIAGVVNMSSSVSLNWAVQTTLFNIPTRGANNSPLLLNLPIDDACVGQPWSHNPGGFDPDGDSLSYELVPSYKYAPPQIPQLVPTDNYVFPDRIQPGPANQFTINPRTGLVSWVTPRQVGVYNFGVRVNEWRNGSQIAYVIRDIAVVVASCPNRPPQIFALQDTCIKAGQSLSFPIRVRDPDPLDSVFLYLNNGINSGLPANNGPFQRGAVINPPNNSALRPQLAGRNPMILPEPPPFYVIQTTFSWVTECDDIRRLPWQVDLYANDDFTRTGPTLADDHITTIRVLGPPVTGVLAAFAGRDSIRVTWNPAACSARVRGYFIYRATDSLAVGPDSCCSGEPGAGYVRIGFNSGHSNTTYIDAGVSFRGRYCYRVAAVYEDGTSSGGPGCVSQQDCIFQEPTKAVLLRNDILSTNPTTGSLALRWRRPDLTGLNPFAFPPPFTYRLFRADGIGGAPTQIEANIAIGDTQRTLNNLNTQGFGHNARVDVHASNGALAAAGEPSSSIYLTAEPADRAVVLRFSSRTSWTNSLYSVFRQPGSVLVANIVPTGDPNQTFTFIDRGLPVNLQQCYIIESSGSYNNPEVHTGLLINRSNQACAVPFDVQPPCLPESFTANVFCDSAKVDFTVRTSSATCDDDLSYYLLYYKPNRNDPDDAYQLIDSIRVTMGGPSITLNRTVRGTFIGCFRLIAVDSSRNQSEPSAPLCVGDECPFLALPNVFTPNGDGQNDRFIPLSYDPFNSKFIRTITCFIYDRWGRLMSTSTNKDNLWDGRTNGSPAAEGTYFYVIEMTLESTERNRKVTRTGSVTLLR